jgi:hypothetical protein
VVDVNKVDEPLLVGELVGGFKNPKAVAIQFRYAFVTDDEGLKVVDISNPTHPRHIPGAFVPLRHAGKLYVARTYAYVADGPQGLAIIDVQNPERPFLDQFFTADGQLNDTRAVSIGSVSASMYALVADGHNGLRVVQMISPDTVAGAQGFSPRPAPRLIATYPTPHPTLAVTRGLDRDRVTDETGNQTVVFGRRGARPFHLDEMRPFLRHEDGDWYKVEDVKLDKSGKLFTASGVEMKDPYPPVPVAPAVPFPGAPLPGQPEIKLQPLDLPPAKPGEEPKPGATEPPATPPAPVEPGSLKQNDIPPMKTLRLTPPAPGATPTPRAPSPAKPAPSAAPATTAPKAAAPAREPVAPGSLQQNDIPATKRLVVPPAPQKQ